MEIRVRLRPWLDSRLAEGNIDGFCWLDKEKGIFRIPWKHHSKHTWTEADAAIFKDWAVVTGRYRAGIDEPDWPMWKTRLRCALNKAPDIQEVKQRHDLHCEEPFKVYRFISKTESTWRANATRNASLMFDGIPPNTKLSFGTFPEAAIQKSVSRILQNLKRSNSPPMQKIPVIENSQELITLLHKRSHGIFVPFVQSTQSLSSNQFSHSLGTTSLLGVECPDPDIYSPSSLNVASHPVHTSNDTPASKSNFWRFWSCPPPNWKCPNSPIGPDVTEPEYHQLGVRIQHLDVRVKDTIVTNPNGCCIFFGRYDEISHPAAPDPVEIQIPHHISQANKEYVDLLLDNMVRGILISVVQGSIFVERMCKCAVFVYLPVEDGEHILLKKLGRRTRELIFDYHDFQTEYRYYCDGHRSKPTFEMILSFGQQLRPCLSTTSLLVWCRIASCRAWFQSHKDSPPSYPDQSEMYDGNMISTSEYPCGSTNGLLMPTDHSNNKRRKVDVEFPEAMVTVSLSDSTSVLVQEDVIEEAVELSLDGVDDVVDEGAHTVYELPTHALADDFVMSR